MLMGLIFPMDDEAEIESLLHGWMDPRGMFLPVARETHEEAAKQILKADPKTVNYSRKLEEQKWIKVSFGEVLIPSASLTPSQKKEIFNFATNEDIPEQYRTGFMKCLTKYEEREQYLLNIVICNANPFTLRKVAEFSRSNYWYGDEYYKIRYQLHL